VPDGAVEAQGRGQWLRQEDAVDGSLTRQLIQQRVEYLLVERFGPPADGGQAVPLESSLDGAQVGVGRRIIGGLDDGKA
jgi:hypothetical protein